MGLLSRGSAWLTKTFNDQESKKVVYFRKETGLLLRDVKAVIGRADRQMQIGIPEAHRETATREFLILSATLAEGGKQFLPSAGDEIIEVQGGNTYTWEVYHDPLDGPFRWHDEEQFNELRIHTLLVKVDDSTAGGSI